MDNFLLIQAKICHFYCIERDTKVKFIEHGKVVFHSVLEFSDCDEPVVRKSRETVYRPGRRQPALAWNGDKLDFACASGGERPVLQSLSALGLHASSSKNRAMHEFVTKLASLSRMLGSV